MAEQPKAPSARDMAGNQYTGKELMGVSCLDAEPSLAARQPIPTTLNSLAAKLPAAALPSTLSRWETTYRA
jgi:hypothetical protein